MSYLVSRKDTLSDYLKLNKPDKPMKTRIHIAGFQHELARYKMSVN
ncbi:hypothetical protein [Alteromonas oceanisediminis]|nr:hypothetical protein [Alteromonas oceanisediminis]MBT0586639.1 hypothetical protein [Alteromonas oceanisediminis]